jgi:hypothetical protein
VIDGVAHLSEIKRKAKLWKSPLLVRSRGRDQERMETTTRTGF